MVLVRYEKNVSMERHHLLKSSIKDDKLNILKLTNENVNRPASVNEPDDRWSIEKQAPKLTFTSPATGKGASGWD